jgi:hypothetical protein
MEPGDPLDSAQVQTLERAVPIDRPSRRLRACTYPNSEKHRGGQKHRLSAQAMFFTGNHLASILLALVVTPVYSEKPASWKHVSPLTRFITVEKDIQLEQADAVR